VPVVLSLSIATRTSDANTDAFGTGNRFDISVSNNAGEGTQPGDPSRDPIAITTSGWYTYTHNFHDNGNGVLAVTMMVADSAGTVLGTWTLSESSDVIGSTVGGHRSGWFANQGLPLLAFDDAKLGPNDTAAPTTVATAANQDNTPYSFGTWTNQPVAVTLTASDTGGAGLTGMFYTVNGGGTQTYDGPISFNNEGSYTLSYWSSDAVGNIETPQTVTVNIVLTNAGLISVVNQFEGNSRFARQMTAALQFAGLGERINNDRLKSIGLTVFMYEVNQQRGRTLTNDQADALIFLAGAI
jgi:hypothetical protein